MLIVLFLNVTLTPTLYYRGHEYCKKYIILCRFQRVRSNHMLRNLTSVIVYYILNYIYYSYSDIYTSAINRWQLSNTHSPGPGAVAYCDREMFIRNWDCTLLRSTVLIRPGANAKPILGTLIHRVCGETEVRFVSYTYTNAKA